MFISGLRLGPRVEKAIKDSGVKTESELFTYGQKMTTFLLHSKSNNTNKKYYYSFNRWKKFASDHDLNDLPAQSIHIALYITSLIDKHSSHYVVESALYAIKWAHDLNGYTDPTDNSFVKSLLESAKRLNAKSVVKKDPVNSEMLIELCSLYAGSFDLLILRDLCMILIAYSGFLRFDEISNLRCKDVQFYDDHIKIFISKSKTDQYRHGNEILISTGSTVACPVNMLSRYMSIAKLDNKSDHFIFKPMFRSKGVAHLIHKNKPISYTTARENIVKRLKEVAPNLNLGLHSLRSGGASAAAKADVNERCIKRHGRWKTDFVKDCYIADTFDKRIAVTKKLGL